MTTTTKEKCSALIILTIWGHELLEDQGRSPREWEISWNLKTKSYRTKRRWKHSQVRGSGSTKGPWKGENWMSRKDRNLAVKAKGWEKNTVINDTAGSDLAKSHTGKNVCLCPKSKGKSLDRFCQGHDKTTLVLWTDPYSSSLEKSRRARVKVGWSGRGQVSNARKGYWGRVMVEKMKGWG